VGVDVSADRHQNWRAAHDAYCLAGGYCFTPGQSDCATLSRMAGLKAAQNLMPPDPNAAIPMLLTCPSCSVRHIDEGAFATKAHHTHACQHCGMVWRPAIGPTVGVRFLPGFKNAVSADTHPKDGDVEQAPLGSGAVPDRADAQPPESSKGDN
jgi:hypothetical protein